MVHLTGLPLSFCGGMPMPDATDLSMVASSALPATFTFLYQRLHGVLDRWRAGRSGEPEPAPEIPRQLVGTLSLPLVADPGRLEQRAAVLEALALSMAHYQRDLGQVSASDQVLLQTLGQVRQALEEIYGQRFTFEGEPREASGPVSDLRIEKVVGRVVVMKAEETISGSASARFEGTVVEEGGVVIGMQAKNIGGRQ